MQQERGIIIITLIFLDGEHYVYQLKTDHNDGLRLEPLHPYQNDCNLEQR